MPRSHGLKFGFAFFAIQTIEQGTELFDFAPQGKHTHFFIAQGTLEIIELAENFTQLALHRQRAFGALFATSNGHVVEALAGLGEKERIRIFQCQTTSHVRFGNDVAVAEFGQDHFQRFAEAVEHSNGVLQRNDLCRWGRAVCGFIEDEGKLGL